MIRKEAHGGATPAHLFGAVSMNLFRQLIYDCPFDMLSIVCTSLKSTELKWKVSQLYHNFTYYYNLKILILNLYPIFISLNS